MMKKCRQRKTMTKYRSKLVSLGFFPDEEKLLLEGKINATLRVKTFGAQVNDYFYAGCTGLKCRITSIGPIAVGPAAEMYCQRLGYRTAQEFLSFWQETHPRTRNDLTQLVFLISFKPEGQ